MKILPDNPKKTIAAFVVIALSIGGIVYFLFFANPSPTPNIDNTALVTGMQNSISQNRSKSLPYGKTINDAVLKSDAFKALKFGPALKLSDSELGKSDLFSPTQAVQTVPVK